MDNMCRLPSPRRLPFPSNTSTQSQGPSFYRPPVKMENMGLLIGEVTQVNSGDELTKVTHIEWKIGKYSYCNPNTNLLLRPDDNLLKSPSFTFANISWNIHLQNEYLLKVRLQNETKIDSEIIFSFGIKKLDGSFEMRIMPTPFEADAKYLYPFFYRSFINDETLGYRHNNTLIIICDIKCTVTRGPKGLKRKRIQTAENMNLAGLESLSKHLKDLYSNKDDCDSVLIVQGKEFKTHRNILTARSSVFAAMFRHDTTEKKTGQVIIPDCDPDSFSEFLEYLYCGRLRTISSGNACHLYKTANKYNVQELKAFCVSYLMQNLTVRNVYDVFTFAEENDETSLFETAQEFFNENFEEISKTSEWENLFRNNFSLATKLLTKMAKAKK